MAEIEGKGVDYERYALRKLFHALVSSYSLRSVLEIPARGEKAMPSIYSLAFAEAGCRVFLINGEEKSRWAWEELELCAEFRNCPDLHHTGLQGAGHDLVWNFMHLAKDGDPGAMLAEMARLSRRYILFIGVNRFNPGFFSHRMAHRLFRVPWNHGNIHFMNPFFVREYFSKNGLAVLKTGVVDTPPYPDSLGIRDMRLHRMDVDLNTIDWDSRTVHWMKAGRYPHKIKLLYLFEQLPLPFLAKLLYAHLFYVLAEKQ
ncbi:MAG: hypothetical protein L3J03_07760 [Desulfobacterales bacterium]|nr:hypothetical protein [Desulfobacterales bacterium]